MSKEVGVGGSSASDSEVLDSLKSRYPCIHDPSSSTADDTTTPDDNDNRYFTSLFIFGNREVDGPESPLPPSFSNLMVDPNIIDPHMIKEKIISALKVLRFRDQRVLVQFWSPVAVRKRWLLTTWDQPFGLGVADKGLYLHRLKSELRAIVIDGEHREDLAPPGRIFSQKLPEWCLDVHGGDICNKAYGYIDLPVFESGGDLCVGILEIITSSSYVDYAFEVGEVSRALKKQNLKSPNALEDPRYGVLDERRQHELDGIFKALQLVCDIHDLPLAQTWTVSGCNSSVANSGNIEQSCSSFKRSCIGKVCMSTADLPFYVRDLSMWGFREACKEHHLEKSRGVVGRSLATCGALFCGNVTELSEDDYPLAPLAHMSGLTSCLAMYLKSYEVAVEYVIEFFLAPHSANEVGLRRLMETVKQQIKSTSCMQSDIMSSPQVIGTLPSDWNHEFPLSPVTFMTEKGEGPPPESENIQPSAKNLQNGVDVIFPKKQSEVAYVEHMEQDNMENEPSTSAVGGTSRSVVPLLEKGIEDSDFNSRKIKRKYSANSKGVSRKRKRAESSIFSLEEVTKHFGKTMDEAAAILEISRSTLKRLCRDLGIPRWPYKNGPDKNDSHMKLDQSELVINGEGRALNPVYGAINEQPLRITNTATENGKHSSTLVLQHEQIKLPDGCAEPQTTVRGMFIETTSANTVENVMIKATYGNDIMKFSFRYLDGLVKLEELVATRFQLRRGSFSLKYVDEEGDMIWIACENDLTTAIDSFRRLGFKNVIRLFVDQISDA